MAESVAMRPKKYSYIIDESDQNKKAKRAK